MLARCLLYYSLYGRGNRQAYFLFRLVIWKAGRDRLCGYYLTLPYYTLLFYLLHRGLLQTTVLYCCSTPVSCCRAYILSCSADSTNRSNNNTILILLYRREHPRSDFIYWVSLDSRQAGTCTTASSSYRWLYTVRSESLSGCCQCTERAVAWYDSILF